MRIRYASVMDTQKKELWDRLDNEPERAYRAFESFLVLPSSERTLLEAYRRHVGNPDAAKPSDTWSGWSNSFAWRERVRAYDDHLASLRREAYERVIEVEAACQARDVEKVRGQCSELLMLAHVRAMEFLEALDVSEMRMSEAIQFIRLQMDFAKTFAVEPESSPDDDWTEEDDAELERIAKEIKARRDSQEGLQDPDEEDSDSCGSDEDRAEDSEGDET